MGAAVLLVLLSLVPQGWGEGRLDGELVFDPVEGQEVFVPAAGPGVRVAVWAGALAGYALLVSPLTGHKPLLRRWMAAGSWRRLHVVVGLLILGFAGSHALAAIWVRAFYTWPSGTAALVVLAAHGASAVWKTSLVRRLGAARWRAYHVATGWIGLVLGLEHAVGLNLAAELGWG